MNILFIDTGLEEGGGTRSLFYLMEGLQKRSLKLFAHFEHDYGIGEIPISRYMERYGVRFVSSPFKKKPMSKWRKELYRLGGKSLLYQKQLERDIDYAKALLRQGEYDCVHLNNHPMSNLAYILAANLLGIPVIQHLRKNVRPYKGVERILKDAQLEAVAISKATQEFYAPYLSGISVIYNPVFSEEKKIKSMPRAYDEIRILMVANYLPLKGHRLVFEAVRQSRNPDIKLWLAGKGGFDAQTEALKKELVALGRVKELGFVQEMELAYQSVDIVLNFSESEGFGRTIIEGLAYGCSIIAPDLPVMHEIRSFASDEAKFRILPRDTDALSACLDALQKPSSFEPDQGVIEQFNQQAYVEGVYDLYCGLPEKSR